VDSPLDSLAERLTARLENDVRLQRADILRDGRGVVVSLPERATFALGSADVTDDAKPLIARVVGELEGGPYALRIEGHTDDVPIRTARYPSNWELSTARAGAVVAYLIGDLDYPADRLSAAGYGEFHPRVPNDSAANRARNRRIDIVVLPSSAEDVPVK
jgi:chemotaxis protein MotB